MSAAPRRPADAATHPARRRAWPLHDAQASRAVEAAALALHAPHALMQRAGLAVARLALALAPHARRVCVACRPGQQRRRRPGGGAPPAPRRARRSASRCWPTRQRLPADARQALREALHAGVAHRSPRRPDDGADLVIDALLGIGAPRAPRGRDRRGHRRHQRAAQPRCWPSTCPPACTPTPARARRRRGARHRHAGAADAQAGLFTGHGRDHAGQVWLDTLGVRRRRQRRRPGWPAPPRCRRWRRAPMPAHKGSFGDVAVVGGAAGMVGAAWLAARAALAAGAGRVYCSLLDAAARPATRAPGADVRAALVASPPAVLAQTHGGLRLRRRRRRARRAAAVAVARAAAGARRRRAECRGRRPGAAAAAAGPRRARPGRRC